MRLAISLVALACFSCSSAPEQRLLGAWRSDRDLTLASIEQVGDLSSEERASLGDPDLFGQLIHVWGTRQGISIFAGECGSPTPYTIRDSTSNSVTVEYYDDFYQEAQSKVVYIGDGQIALPILGGRAREVFVRTDLAALKAQYPCLTSF